MITRAIPFDQIPGEFPYQEADEDPQLYRLYLVAKALRAAYEDAADDTNPQQAVRDILADLRHLCDATGLDFATEDRTAYENYSKERHTWSREGLKNE